MGLDGVNPVYHETIKVYAVHLPRPPAFLYSQSASLRTSHLDTSGRTPGSRERAAAAVLGEEREYVPPQHPARDDSDSLLAQRTIFHSDLAPPRHRAAPHKREPTTPERAAHHSLLPRAPAAHPAPHHAPADPFLPVDLKPPESSPRSCRCRSCLGTCSSLHCCTTRRAQADWEALQAGPREVVAKTFTRRGRAEAVWSGILLVELGGRAEKYGREARGFLLGETAFKGLMKALDRRVL